MNGDSLMPQILKEEVRQDILDNALKSFIAYGYKNTSMKAIAQSTGISVGNIYNYFKDKEALYDALVLSVFNKINELFKTPPKDPTSGVDEKIMAFIEIYKSNKEVFIMLLENSENTKFENLKHTVTENFAAAIERFRYQTMQSPQSPVENAFLKALVSAFVNGIIVILSQDIDEELKLEVLQEFSATMKAGLINKFIIKRGKL